MEKMDTHYTFHDTFAALELTRATTRELTKAQSVRNKLKL
jgi:hypothetical protein